MINKIAKNYFLATTKAYNKLHNLPFVGNEDYWTGRIYAYELFGKIHNLESSFKQLHKKSELPLDVYMDLNSRLIIAKSKLKRWLISIPSLDKSMNEEKINDVFKKIEKISETISL